MGDSSWASFSFLRTGVGVAFVQLALEGLAELGSFFGNEISVIYNVEDELQKLRTTSSTIKELVDDEDNILQMIYGRSNARELFEKLQKLDYEADDLLDYISLHLSEYCARRSVASNQERQLLHMVLSSFRELNLPHKIAEMHQKLDQFVIEMERLPQKRIKLVADTISGRSSQTSSYSLKDSYGRDKDKDCIVSLLHKNDGTSTTTNFSVISILGMHGIGKTTVAQLACDAVNFEKKIWVPLSGDFDTIKITKSIIDATGSACNLSDLGSLQLRLQEILCESKFLIVLDDYCSENRDDWVTLTRPFQYGSQGSKVIVTTRNMKASRTAVRANEECILEILSDDDCWEIIKKSAMMSVELSQDLNSLGMQIAKKCQGLPQVANTLGNMLYGKCTEQEWRHVLERDMWDLLRDYNILFHFHLVESYAHLPPHLQKCFAYCSIFPQGFEFEIEDLILLWMAEGFIQQPAQDFKELGRDYLNELYLRFFFQQFRTPSNQIRYKIHDLIHGMIRLVSKNTCFHAKHDQSKPYHLFGNARHLSLLHDDIQSLELKASEKNEGLRTFLVMRSSSSSNASPTTILDPQLFSYLKFLKVLGLGGVGLTELVDSIGLLECLRYLNLSHNPISSLPKSVCKIFALQILKLRNCDKLRDLPEEMSNLINLIHLEFNERMFKVMPPHFRKLVKLQYLSAYTVSKKNGCGIGELNSLNCLGGELCIRKIEVSNISEAKEAMLDLKTHLDTLNLVWTSRGTHDEVKSLEQAHVFVELRPHLNLKKLVINSYFGLTYPPWLSDPSHNFTSIDLNGLNYCGNLPSLGELPKLTSFSISDMPCLKLIGHTFYGAMKFPSLKSFQIRGLSNLTHWEEAHGNGNVMPCLRVFTLNDCQQLSRLPENLQELLPVSTVSGCPRLQAMIPMQTDVEGASRMLCIS